MARWLRKIRRDFNPSAKSLCPCCGAALVIDLNLGRVISHSEPSSGLNIELSDAQRILADEKARREAAFEQSFNTERTKGDALSKRFEEALKQAKEEPITQADPRLRPRLSRSCIEKRFESSPTTFIAAAAWTAARAPARGRRARAA